MSTKIFSGRYSSLASISEFVAEAAGDTDFSPSEIYTIKLAVDEACTNIIEHAYGGEGLGDIQCTCETSKNQMTITLKDQGKTFDPEYVPEPNFDVPLEALQTRGAGLFFMRKLMDEVRFDFDSQKGNVLVLVKRKQV